MKNKHSANTPEQGVLNLEAVVNTANFHEYGKEESSWGYIIKKGKQYELRFVCGIKPRLFNTLLDAQQYIINAHPMAYVWQPA